MPLAGNLYEIMGLPRYAPIDEVKITFRRLAVQFHPDKNPGNAAAEERFKQISGAYDILGDEQKKREYDLRLSGYHTYIKVESPAEQRRKMQAEILRRKRQKQAREEKEIKEIYAKARRNMPYHWRYLLSGVGMFSALLLIINNWFLYDIINERNIAFFKMFMGYGLTLATILFFLNSLFKRWNAENINKRFHFDIRARIASFFVAYLVFIVAFSFTAPGVYKNYQLSEFGQTTVGTVSGEGRELELIYYVDGKKISKALNVPTPYYGYSAMVTVKYSVLQPHVSEIIETSSYRSL